MKKITLQQYFVKKLNISLSEANLLEKEIKNYIKIKKSKSLRETEIDYVKRYNDSLNIIETYFTDFFIRFDRSLNKGDEKAIEYMKNIIKNNDSENLSSTYPRELRDMYNTLYSLSNFIKSKIKENPEEIEKLNNKFVNDFVSILKELDPNPSYFWISNKEQYSKKDLFLKVEDLKSTVAGVSVSSIFKKMFGDDLKTLLS